MANQATAITEHDPSGRLIAPHDHDELGRLAAAFNALLDRLAAALRAQRQFMADASHELRTPVSVVRTTAQVTLARDERSQDEYREASPSSPNNRPADPAGRRHVHALARRGTRAAAPARAGVRERHRRGMRAQHAGPRRSARIRIDIEGDPELPASADDNLLRQLFGNLLDNAIRHAATAVTVTIVRGPDTATVCITNDGPSIPPADRQRIFERFVRLEKGRAAPGWVCQSPVRSPKRTAAACLSRTG